MTTAVDSIGYRGLFSHRVHMGEEYDPAVYDDEDEAPAALQAVKHRALRAELSAILLRFEKASDWADYASQLGEIRRCLNRHSQHAFVPEKFALAKWLSHCLYMGYPAGLHLKALELYELVFRRIGPRRLAKDLGLYSVGLFPLMSYCSTAVKPKLLDIYRRYIVGLQAESLRPQHEQNRAPDAVESAEVEHQHTVRHTDHLSLTEESDAGTNSESRLPADFSQRRIAMAPTQAKIPAENEHSRLLMTHNDDMLSEGAPKRMIAKVPAVADATAPSSTETLQPTPGTLIEIETSTSSSWPVSHEQWPEETTRRNTGGQAACQASPLAAVLPGLIQGLLPALDDTPGTTPDGKHGAEVLALLAQIRESVGSDVLFGEAIWKAMLSVDFNGWAETEWIPRKLAASAPTDRFMAARRMRAFEKTHQRLPAGIMDAPWPGTRTTPATAGVSVPFSAVQHAELDQTQHAESSLASRLRLTAMQYLLALVEEMRTPSSGFSKYPMAMAALFANTKLVTMALVRALSDRNSLVVRQALDLLLQTIEFTEAQGFSGNAEHSSIDRQESFLRVRDTTICLSAEESRVLLGHALLVFLREDASLHKRLYAWIEENPSGSLIQDVLEEHFRSIGAVSIEDDLYPRAQRLRGHQVVALSTIIDQRSVDTLQREPTTLADPCWVGDTSLALIRMLHILVRRQRLCARLEFTLISAIWRLGRLVLLTAELVSESDASVLAQERMALPMSPHPGEMPSSGKGTGRIPALLVRSRRALWSALNSALSDLIKVAGPDRLWIQMLAQFERLEGRLEPPESLRVLFECLLFLVQYAGLPSVTEYGVLFTIIRESVLWCARFKGTTCTGAQLPSLDSRYNFPVLAKIVSGVRSTLSLANPTIRTEMLEHALVILDLFEKRVWRPWLEQAGLVHANEQRWRQMPLLETLRTHRLVEAPWLVEDARAGCDFSAELVRLALSIHAMQEENGSEPVTKLDHQPVQSMDKVIANDTVSEAVSNTATTDRHRAMETQLSATLQDAMQLAISGSVPIALLGLDHYLDLMDSALQRNFVLDWPLADVPADAFTKRLIQQCWLFLHPSLPSSGKDTALLWYSLQEFYPSECQHFVADALSSESGSLVENLEIFARAFCLARELKLAQSLPSSCLFLVLDQLRSQHTACRFEAERFVLDAVRLAPELVIGPLLGILLCESYPVLNERQEFIARPDMDRVLYAFETLRFLFATLEQHAIVEAAAGFRGLASDARLLYRALGTPASSAILAAITAVSGPEDHDLIAQDYLDACLFVVLWYLRARWSTHCMHQLQTYGEESGPFRFVLRNLQASFADVQESVVQFLEQMLRYMGLHGDLGRIERLAAQAIAILEPLLESAVTAEASPRSPTAPRPLSALVARTLRALLNLTTPSLTEEMLRRGIRSWSLSPGTIAQGDATAAAVARPSDQGDASSLRDQVVMADALDGEVSAGVRKHRKSKRHGKRLWPKAATWSRMGGFLSGSNQHD